MKNILIITILIISTNLLFAQKKTLSHSVYEKWKTIDNAIISNDGNWVSYQINPLKGDGFIYLHNVNTGKTDSLSRGKSAQFSPNNDYLIFRIEAQADTIRKMKLNKIKTENLPKDTLAIWLLSKDSIIYFPNLKSFKLPKEASSWLVAQFQLPETTKDKKEKTDTAAVKKEMTDAEKKEQKKKVDKEKKQLKTFVLAINPILNKSLRFDRCDNYSISDNGKSIALKQVIKDSLDTSIIIIYNTQKNTQTEIIRTTSSTSKFVFDKNGEKIAYLLSADTAKNKVWSLCIWNEKSGKSLQLADTVTQGMPSGFSVSENGNIYFSDNSTRIFFGISPNSKPEKKDTLTDDEKYSVDIWKWDDARMQSQQLKELKNDQKKSYLCMLDLVSGKLIRIEDEQLERAKTFNKGNSDYVLVFNSEKYKVSYTWKNSRSYDAWLVNLRSGEKKEIVSNLMAEIGISPQSKYVYWYNANDSNWYTMNIASGKKTCITNNKTDVFYQNNLDIPSVAPAYGMAGWSDNDKSILIYSRYDIWSFEPELKEPPVCLTSFYGRKNYNRLRYLKFNPDEKVINLQKPLILSVFNEKDKKSGLISLKLPASSPQVLVFDHYSYDNLKKAKNQDVFLFTRENYQTFPDLWITKNNFTTQSKLTNANNQQKDYWWGSVSMISYQSDQGDTLDGLLYIPENLEKNKKYPAIIYYYERYTDDLYQHYMPVPSRSVINFPLFNSNGYIIFIPDIYYKTGYPGESAYKTVMTSVDYLSKLGYVDMEKLGLQGQSWGGYQTAYIITKTNIFKAAMAGAAVSNMTSAYGGIRWESGVSRAFQYEEGQSRLGATLWERPDLYIENSPVFHADKITTPLLMMNNDNDGAVPWQQGIELYTAMRRLQKPCWMLVYNNEEHNLTKWPNRVDLSIRMLQFFNHYLKDEPAPEWMKNGLPAIDKGTKSAYELLK